MPVSPLQTTPVSLLRPASQAVTNTAPPKRHGLACRLLTFLGIRNRPGDGVGSKTPRGAVPQASERPLPVPTSVHSRGGTPRVPAMAPPAHAWAARASKVVLQPGTIPQVPAGATQPQGMPTTPHTPGPQPVTGTNGTVALHPANHAVGQATHRALTLSRCLVAWAAEDLRQGRHADASAFLGRADGRVDPSRAAGLAAGFDRLAADLSDLERRPDRLHLLTAHSMQGNLCYVLEGDPQRRIFLHPAFHQRDIVDRAVSLIHEASHHVLRTEDLHSFPGGHLFFGSAAAGARPYQRGIAEHLAGITPRQARHEMVRNADSWANLAVVMALSGHRQALEQHLLGDRAAPSQSPGVTHVVRIAEGLNQVHLLSPADSLDARAQRDARKGDAPLKPSVLLTQLQNARWTTLAMGERKAFHEAALSLALARGLVQEQAAVAHMTGLSDQNVLERLNGLLPVLGLPRVDNR